MEHRQRREPTADRYVLGLSTVEEADTLGVCRARRIHFCGLHYSWRRRTRGWISSAGGEARSGSCPGVSRCLVFGNWAGHCHWLLAVSSHGGLSMSESMKRPDERLNGFCSLAILVCGLAGADAQLKTKSGFS